MKNKKCKALSGKDNNRLNLKMSVSQNNTAAWSDEHKAQPVSNVTTPSVENTVNAKEWVDNGSRL